MSGGYISAQVGRFDSHRFNMLSVIQNCGFSHALAQLALIKMDSGQRELFLPISDCLGLPNGGAPTSIEAIGALL